MPVRMLGGRKGVEKGRSAPEKGVDKAPSRISPGHSADVGSDRPDQTRTMGVKDACPESLLTTQLSAPQAELFQLHATSPISELTVFSFA